MSSTLTCGTPLSGITEPFPATPLPDRLHRQRGGDSRLHDLRYEVTDQTCYEVLDERQASLRKNYGILAVGENADTAFEVVSMTEYCARIHYQVWKVCLGIARLPNKGVTSSQNGS